MVRIDVPAETFFSENLVFMPVHHESKMPAFGCLLNRSKVDIGKFSQHRSKTGFNAIAMGRKQAR
jgi:hypothetical protein